MDAATARETCCSSHSSTPVWRTGPQIQVGERGAGQKSPELRQLRQHARREPPAVYGPHRIAFRSAAAAFAGVSWKRSQRSERHIAAFLRGENCHFHVSGAPHSPRTLTQYPCGELTPSDPGFDEPPVAFPEDGSGPQIWHTFEIGTPNPGVAVLAAGSRLPIA